MKKIIIMICLLTSILTTGSVMAQGIKEIRDPFKPFDLNRLSELSSREITTNIKVSVKEPQKKLRIVLTGIIWDKQNPFAIVSISGQKKVVGVNDKIEGRKVTKITQKRVLLNWNSKTFILKVGKEIVL